MFSDLLDIISCKYKYLLVRKETFCRCLTFAFIKYKFQATRLSCYVNLDRTGKYLSFSLLGKYPPRNIQYDDFFQLSCGSSHQELFFKRFSALASKSPEKYSWRSSFFSNVIGCRLAALLKTNPLKGIFKVFWVKVQNINIAEIIFAELLFSENTSHWLLPSYSYKSL